MREVNSNFSDILSASKDEIGTHETARAILEDQDLYEEILKMVFSKTHHELKDSLKKVSDKQGQTKE